MDKISFSHLEAPWSWDEINGVEKDLSRHINSGSWEIERNLRLVGYNVKNNV